MVVRTFENALESAEKPITLSRMERSWDLHGVPMTIKESYVMAEHPPHGALRLTKIITPTPTD